MTMTMDVEKLAYELWEKNGRPEGQDQEHYYAAERMLAEGNGAAAPKKTATRARSTSAKPRASSTKSKKQA